MSYVTYCFTVEFSYFKMEVFRNIKIKVFLPLSSFHVFIFLVDDGIAFLVSVADLPVGVSFVLHADVVPHAQPSIDMDARRRENSSWQAPNWI
jgi:hypothetical protein